ncbi:hypothetical protein EVAR_54261_1 [Eumeta japonica]|uniref:Uncharacterized protein n=1 Tax=Eumeta variegata TaxID=151549 RepID=A0A4C1YFV0_EUMVA|nr:hypothetical protein EVAR_54261_1 [Eumeta japonica]
MAFIVYSVRTLSRRHTTQIPGNDDISAPPAPAVSRTDDTGNESEESSYGTLNYEKSSEAENWTNKNRQAQLSRNHLHMCETLEVAAGVGLHKALARPDSGVHYSASQLTSSIRRVPPASAHSRYIGPSQILRQLNDKLASLLFRITILSGSRGPVRCLDVRQTVDA